MTKAVDALAKANETEEFESHSSLRLYTELQHSYADGMPRYLDDRHNLAGTRLLTKCRLGSVRALATRGWLWQTTQQSL